MNASKILSVIIPHYETPLLLGKLLDTIPTEEGIEVIVIDDCSVKYINEYQDVKKHYANKNVSFIECKHNKGAGHARNIGLDRACGEWIIFADADDLFLDEWFDKVKTAIAQATEFEDIIFFSPTSKMENGTISNRAEHYKSLVENYMQNPCPETATYLRFKFWGPYSKLIRHSMLKKYHIFFEESRWSNDLMFTAKIGYYAREISTFDASIYCILEHSGSLTQDQSKKSLAVRNRILKKRQLWLSRKLMFKSEWKYLFTVKEVMIMYYKVIKNSVPILFLKYVFVNVVYLLNPKISFQEKKQKLRNPRGYTENC